MLQELSISKKQNSKYWLCGDIDETVKANRHKRNKRIGMAEWERWFNGNCARERSLTILKNDICSNQNLSKKMKRIIISRDFKIQTKYPIHDQVLI